MALDTTAAATAAACLSKETTEGARGRLNERAIVRAPVIYRTVRARASKITRHARTSRDMKKSAREKNASISRWHALARR